MKLYLMGPTTSSHRFATSSGRICHSLVLTSLVAFASVSVLSSVTSCSSIPRSLNRNTKGTYETADIVMAKLVEGGKDMRRIAELRDAGPDVRNASKLSEFANDHEVKYRKYLVELARLPRKSVDRTIENYYSSVPKKDRAVVSFIRTHLLLLNLDIPPENIEVYRDYESLRM